MSIWHSAMIICQRHDYHVLQCYFYMMKQSNGEPILQVRHLTTIFPDGNSGLHALEDISFSVYPEQFVCVLGPSGSGKTTLLRNLAGLLPPTRGEVLFGNPSSSTNHHLVGMVFQKANLMPWRTVLENILLPLEIQHVSHTIALQKAQALVELVGLSGFEDSLPRDLSGGMAQRVAIARALIHEPYLLLLDEPFGSLDALTRERMGIELIRIWQARRKTVIMVTHSISESLFLADRVLVLSQRPGRLRLDLRVDLPRPREEDIRYSEEFSKLARQVRAAIE
jgi:NitT/TauT family transport system ATP-binding protein